MENSAIQLRQLTKDYGRVRALTSVDLAVECGEIFGFLGNNGAGKTTTIRILLDLIRPTTGSATVLGLDTQRDSIEVRRHIGYLPSDPRMYERMTALEYFTLVARIHDKHVNTDYRDQLVDRLQLDPTRRIGSLSRGNRQKVGIVQALMMQHDLLILDEPTTGLDPLMQEEVQVLLRETTSEGRTVFFSSHDLAEVEQVCNRVAMLRSGRLLDVFDLAEHKNIASQKIIVTFATTPTHDAIANIENTLLLSLEGPKAVFELRDSIDALLKSLSRFTIAHLETQQPTLEDLFLSYYADGQDMSSDTDLNNSEHATVS